MVTGIHASRPKLFTVGHSSIPESRLIDLLKLHGVDAVVDVRSQPFSRHHPQYHRAALRDSLKLHGVRYAFMGDTLGGRPADSRHYDDSGYVDYASWARSADYRGGLIRLRKSLDRYRVALLCSEEDPAQCHRHLLIARSLLDEGWAASDILHIRSKGNVVSEEALAHQLGLDGERDWKSPQSVLHKVQPNGSSNA